MTEKIKKKKNIDTIRVVGGGGGGWGGGGGAVGCGIVKKI